MGEQFRHSGSPSGFLYGDSYNTVKVKNDINDESKKRRSDKDLIIEENTVYEIDRECYERLKRQKRHKV